MNKIYTDINAATGGKYKALRFSRVTFDGKRAVVTIACKPDDRAFVNANRAELAGLVCDKCAFHAPVEIEVNDEMPTAGALRAAVVGFTEKFSYVSSILHTVSAQTEPQYKVSLKMHVPMYELAKNDYIPRLKEYLQSTYAQDVELDVAVVQFSESGTEYASASGGGRSEYAVTDVTPVIGSLAPSVARSVSSLTANEFNVVACGVFVMPTAFTSKGGKRYDRFLLYDGDTSLQCRWGTEGGRSIVDPSLINKKVCVLGNVEYDAARNEASMSVRELSLCETDGIKVLENRPVPTRYERIVPTDYLEFVQSSMFDATAELPPALKGEFVVFDFETTGLSVLYDKPTELGAVKIVDGAITQCFGTLIDPRREIPPQVIEKTGITNEMVKGQPLFEDVLPDFYKFTQNCGLVCHNIAFDFPFLIKGGNRSGWAFGDRRTYDTMGMAPAVFRGIQRVSLASVLEELGLVNDGAHRAVSDAAATAKAFVAMHRLLAAEK